MRRGLRSVPFSEGRCEGVNVESTFDIGAMLMCTLCDKNSSWPS